MKKLFACLFLILFVLPVFVSRAVAQERIEEMRGKRVLILSPHPDDDTFCCGGLLALLARNGNDVRVALFTNDDKGSYDLEMTSQRLAAIRKAEEEAAAEALGLPRNVIWMGYNDGELEYVPLREIVERTTLLIRQFRPEVLLAVEPGQWYERWHKSDHRMAAFAAIDAVRAAEFHLYFPNQRLQQGVLPWKVPVLLFYYNTPEEQNYWVNVDAVMDQKIEAYSKHVSQFSPAAERYRPDWAPADLEKFKQQWRLVLPRKDGHYVEGYRRATGFNQK